ncbi:MAG: hypothetical protein JWP58_97 [Hymenobacter sp.]|nr:hypothetical protein [Hymenobacter sp.]
MLLWWAGARPGHAQVPGFLWAKDSGRYPISPVSAWGQAVATKTAVDAAGNTYIVGSFTGRATFDALTLTSAGGSDVFVAKLDGAGNYLWAVGAGGTDDDEGLGLALDAQGQVYVTGAFRRTAAFGAAALVSAGFRDVFVAQLSAATGAWGWAARGGGGDDEAGQGVAVDGTGVYLTGGLHSSPAVFGSTTLVNTTPVRTVLVAKLTLGGAWLWATSSRAPGAGQATDTDPQAIAADGSGGAYVVGSYWILADFGSTRLATVGNVGGPNDLFVARLSATGAWQWAVRGGGAELDAATGVVVGPGGSPYITGYSNSPVVTLGTTPPLAGGGNRNFDVLVAKLTPAGAFVWSTLAGGPGGEAGNDITVDAAGDAYVAGFFGPVPARFGASTLTSVGGVDAFVAKLSSTGAWQWGVAGGSLDDDIGATGVGIDGAGNISFVGAIPNHMSSSRNAAALGPYTVPGNLGYNTGFVARLGLPLSVRISGDSLRCAGGQAQLVATATGTPLAYAWSTGATTAAITVGQAGTYSVVVTFAGGRTATAAFTVRSFAPVVRILGDTALCPGTALRLTADGPAGVSSYQWSTGATTSAVTVSQPGVYALTAQYGSGCAVTVQRTVTAPTVTVLGVGPLCPGASRTLTATASSPASFRWSTGVAGATLSVAQAGTYTVTATLPTGCVITQSAVVGPPVAAIRGDSVLCSSTPVGLNAQQADATAYLWSTGATSASIAVDQPGTYSVTVFYPGGCQRTARVQVRRAPGLAAVSLGADTTACAGPSVVLRPIGLGNAAGVTYRWSTGATTSTLVVAQSGSYGLQLTTACETRSLSRRVEFQPCVTIPNVITPNGDRQNETFVVNGLVGTWSLQLYTRWGQRVYTTESYHNEWGAGAAPGVYYYLLRQPGNPLVYKGWLEVAP